NSEVIMRGSERQLRTLAVASFESLMFVVILSLVMLVPLTRHRLMGGMLIGLGVVQLVVTVRHLIAGRGQKGKPGIPARLRMRLVLPAAAAVFIAVSGIQLTERQDYLGFQLLAA